MRQVVWTLALALTLTAPSIAQTEEPKTGEGSKAAEATWIADYDKAVEQAKKEKKDLLVDFTGSDWCGWCIKLHEEVFAHDEFTQAVTKDYVLVALDFPQAEDIKAKVPNPARNAELGEKFGIQGYPTILLVTVDGEVYGRTGYQPGGPVKYVEHLKEKGTAGKKAVAESKELTKTYAAAADKDKPAMIEKAMEKLAALEDGTPGAEALVAIVKDAFKLDADNKAGLKLKAVKALVKSGKADAEVRAAAKALDPKNENGLLEMCVLAECQSVQSKEAAIAALKSIADLDALGPIKDKETAKILYINAASWNMRAANDKAEAKKWAKKAKEHAGDDERLNKFLDSILEDEAK
jgi:thioredoxin-related protein